MIRFRVTAEPATQGSMRHVGHGRIVHDNPPKLRVWRRAVEAQATQVMRNRQAIDAPVSVHCEFILTRPKSVRRLLPSAKPDLDKLMRAVGDALENVVVTNDSRIVSWVVTKRYADPGEKPGAMVAVEEIGDAAA